MSGETHEIDVVNGRISRRGQGENWVTKGKFGSP